MEPDERAIFKVLKVETKNQARILSIVKISINNESDIYFFR